MPSAIPKTMIAYRRVPTELNPVPERLPVPTPGANEVLIKVLAAGVCHSDIGLLTPGEPYETITPRITFTLGHETAGIIAELGPDVQSVYPKYQVGDYVAVWGGYPCYKSTCISCGEGKSYLCPKYAGFHGLSFDGSWAAYIKVHASCVVPIPAGPDRVPPAAASAATDAIATPYHAMKTVSGVGAQHTVLCMGIGGLGLNGVAVAKHCLGARTVIACDLRPTALADARAAGADHAVPPAELQELLAAHNLAVDFAFDFVGIQATFDACYAALRPAGTLHVVGLGSKTIVYSQFMFMLKEAALRTSLGGTPAELSEILQAIADGKLRPKVETRPMSQCKQVLDEMRAGKLQARIALVPDEEVA